MGRIGLAEQVLPKKFCDEIDRIIDRHGLRAKNDSRNVGRCTKARRRTVLMHCFAELYQLGRRIETPTNLRDTHVRVLVDHWVANERAPATITNNLSMLRMFAEWIGKEGMVGRSETYVLDKSKVKRSTVTTTNRSWEAKGIDLEAKFREADAEGRIVGVAMRLMHAFGLRLLEAVSLNPKVHVVMDGKWLSVRDGTKGGRQRMVPIETDYQRQVIALAAEFADKKTGWIARRGKDREKAYNRVRNVCRKLGLTKKELGVTPHGLRHQYGQNSYKDITGRPSPIAGGDPMAIDRETHERACLETMERLGHSRKDVGGAYYGSFGHAMRRSPATPGELMSRNEGEKGWTTTPIRLYGKQVSTAAAKSGDGIAKQFLAYGNSFGLRVPRVEIQLSATSIDG